MTSACWVELTDFCGDSEFTKTQRSTKSFILASNCGAVCSPTYLPLLGFWQLTDGCKKHTFHLCMPVWSCTHLSVYMETFHCICANKFVLSTYWHVASNKLFIKHWYSSFLISTQFSAGAVILVQPMKHKRNWSFEVNIFTTITTNCGAEL